MTQYVMDPASVNLADFTLRHGSVSGPLAVVDDGGVTALRMSPDGTVNIYSYDPVPSVADIEIVQRVRMSTASSGNIGLCISRLQTASFTCYGAGNRKDPGQLSLISYVNGAVAGIANPVIGFTPTTYFWQRFKLTGTTLESKVWTGTPADEPASYDVTVTNSDVTAAGLMGIGARLTSSVSYYAWIGIGTGGDPAPTGLATTPTIRKGSQFTVDKPGSLGTVTTATIAGVNVFDHVTGQVGTTVSFAGAATDEITTSGEYTLVLGDGTSTENITLQVNVVGLPVYNLNKDGADLASLADVEVLVMTGAAGSRVINQNTASGVTDVSGNTVAYEVTDTALTVDQSVFVIIHSAAGAVGIPFTETLELI